MSARPRGRSRSTRRRPRRLWLLRHAKSSRSDPELADVARPLTRRGERAAQAMARYATKRLDAAPSLVLCSSARRALDTLAPWRERLPEDARVRVERPLYLASAARLLARLRRLPDATRDVLLVGHDPGLHELAVALARPAVSAAAARLREKLPTGGLVVLELDVARWRDLAAGTARLAAFVRPRDLA